MYGTGKRKIEIKSHFAKVEPNHIIANVKLKNVGVRKMIAHGSIR